MPRPGPSEAAIKTAADLPLNAPPKRAQEVLTEIYIQQRWTESLSIAQEKAERQEGAYLTYLRRELDTAVRLGRPLRFAFNSSSEDLLQGACFIEPGDSPDVVVAKERRLYYTFHGDWLRDISPQDFECVCRGILGAMGAANPQLTPYSGDQGIDFFGRLTLEGRLAQAYSLSGFDRRLSVWLVGQAKHYKAVKVATPDLRELVGSVELARTQTFARAGGSLDELKLLPCDPVFYLFFTTGVISRDGWELIEKSGIIGLDGEMVAAYLADRGIGISTGSFSISELNGWLDTYRR